MKHPLRLTLALGLLTVLLMYGAVGAGALWLYRRYADGLQILEPRLQRLAGLTEVAPDIEAALQQARAAAQPWPHPGGASAATDAQQRVRQTIEAAGLTAVALQAGEPQPWGPGLARLQLTATVTGAWPAVTQWMHTLQTHQPAFWVQSAQLMREGRDAPGEPQTVRLTVQIDAALWQEGGAP